MKIALFTDSIIKQAVNILEPAVL